MRTLIFLLVLAAVAAAGVTTVVHPEGSSTTAGGLNGLPFSTIFASELRYQLFIPASSLPNRPAMFTDVAFAPSATGSFNMGQLLFSVGHAAPGAPTCNLAGNMKNVRVIHSGTHAYSYTANTWSSFGIPINFPYDGTSGLILEFRWRNASGGGSFRQGTTQTIRRVYNRYAGGYNATTCSHGVSQGVRAQLTFVQATVDLGGTPKPGLSLPLTFDSPTDPGAAFVSAASFGTTPGIHLPGPDRRTIGLNADALFILSLMTPALFRGFQGTLDSQGKGGGSVLLPAGLPSAFTFYLAFVTIGPTYPSGLRSISLSRKVTVP